MRGKPVVLVVLVLVASLVVPIALAATRPAPASGLGGNATANKAKAESEATRLLGTIQLPPGTTRTATEPPGDQATLRGPASRPATPNFVDAHAWWTTSGSATSIYDYVAAHLPRGARVASTAGFGGGPPGTVLSAAWTWNLRPIPGVLTQRTIALSIATLNGRVVGVRTDGEAIWQTPRPAWDVIPSSARTATLTAHGADPHTGRAAPASSPITLSPRQTRKLVAFINGAQVVQPGVTACPASFDVQLTLAFKDANGRIVARAVENPSGCATITLTVRGRTGPALTDYPSLTGEIVRIGAVGRCNSEQLTPSVELPVRNGSMGARSVFFTFLNRSRSICTLAGFPTLQLFDAGGRRLRITLTDSGASIVRRQGIDATSVLDPRTSAAFAATFTTCAGAPAAASARVTLPGIAKPFILPVGSKDGPVAPCDGKLSVTNV